MLMGETSPIGNSHVVAPLTFLRGALCLSASYHRARGCGRVPVDGYAHHPYTRRAGPSFRPPSSNAVTIGTLSRLTRALDRAAARRARSPATCRVYLTEFGVQSKPDPLFGVSLAQQAEFRSIAEHIAYRNRRVAAFSQYLMRDDLPASGPGASALQRIRVGPALLRRPQEALLRGLPPAPGGGAPRLARLAVGPGAPGGRRHHRCSPGALGRPLAPAALQAHRLRAATGRRARATARAGAGGWSGPRRTGPTFTGPSTRAY